jgi:hypothetical protein
MSFSATSENVGVSMGSISPIQEIQNKNSVCNNCDPLLGGIGNFSYIGLENGRLNVIMRMDTA